MSVLDVTSLAQAAIAGGATAVPKSPSTPNDVAVTGPTPQLAPVPFWDAYSRTLGDSKDGDGSASNSSFSPWDVCALAGLALPGVAKVLVKAKKRFDVKKSKGKNGATLTFTGYDPSELSIELRVWTPVHLNALASVMPMLKQKATTTGGAQATAAQLAMDINHPTTTLLGIHSVLIESVSGLEPADQKGVMRMQIRCLEYIPPSKTDVTATPSGAQNFNNQTAINGAKQTVPMPSADASFTGPNGALASFQP